MDIWLSRCNKRSKCHHCGEPITTGEPEVFGKLWRKYGGKDGGESRTWTIKFHWHARRTLDGQCCWLVQALEELSKRQFVEKRGRQRLLLTADVREKRLALLRKRARTVQLIKEEMEKEEDWRSIDTVIRYGVVLEKLKEQIRPLGGVPKSWE